MDKTTAEGQTEKANHQNSINTPPRTAFFITPLGSDNSEIRRSTDGLIDAVVEPVLAEFNITLIPPHKIKNPGNITRQIVRHILDCDLVIANLTGLNPNVMYELAIRHAKRKPVIVIAEDPTKLPFDIAAERTIFYNNDMRGAVELMARLRETIPVALLDGNPENPVYLGLESSIIQEQVKKENDPVQAYLVEKLDQLSDNLSALRTETRRTIPELQNIQAPSSTKDSGIAAKKMGILFKDPLSEEDVTRLGNAVGASLPVISIRYVYPAKSIDIEFSSYANPYDVFNLLKDNGFNATSISPR